MIRLPRQIYSGSRKLQCYIFSTSFTYFPYKSCLIICQPRVLVLTRRVCHNVFSDQCKIRNAINTFFQLDELYYVYNLCDEQLFCPPLLPVAWRVLHGSAGLYVYDLFFDHSLFLSIFFNLLIFHPANYCVYQRIHSG